MLTTFARAEGVEPVWINAPIVPLVLEMLTHVGTAPSVDDIGLPNAEQAQLLELGIPVA